MSERKETRKEKEWNDSIPDPEEPREDWEETYRDGTAKHECWADEDRE